MLQAFFEGLQRFLFSFLPAVGFLIDRLLLLCKSIAKKQDAPFSRPFGATENDAQKLHALLLLPMIVVRNTAHEVLCENTKGGGSE